MILLQYENTFFPLNIVHVCNTMDGKRKQEMKVNNIRDTYGMYRFTHA